MLFLSWNKSKKKETIKEPKEKTKRKENEKIKKETEKEKVKKGRPKKAKEKQRETFKNKQKCPVFFLGGGENSFSIKSKETKGKVNEEGLGPSKVALRATSPDP